MAAEIWLTFAFAWFVLSLAPGPDNLFVLMQSLIYGRRDGLWVVSGLCTGLMVHLVLVGVGVAALIRASDIAFTALKIAGAAYLAYLAYLAWRAPTQEVALDGTGAQPVGRSAVQLWRRGLIMNLTNPKVIIFFLAFFPQFLRPEDNVLLQMLVMGITVLVICVLVFGGVAVGAAYVRSWVKSERVQKAINRTGAVIFMLLAVNILLA